MQVKRPHLYHMGLITRGSIKGGGWTRVVYKLDYEDTRRTSGVRHIVLVLRGRLALSGCTIDGGHGFSLNVEVVQRGQ